MRVLIIILTLIISGSSSAQTLYPFQVLYAENAKSSDGKILKSMDMVSIHESIKIENEGSIVLIHRSGFPIEINKDTIIRINELDEVISPPFSGKSRLKKEKNIQWVWSRGIAIDFLLISDKILANKRKLSSLGLVSDQNENMEIIYPPMSTRQVNFSNDFYVRWRPLGKENYSVEIKDMYDSVLSVITTNKSELKIPEIEMREIMKSKDMLLFTLKELKSKTVSNTFLVKEFDLKGIPNPYPSEIVKPSSALLMGFFLEISFWDYSKTAEEYYILATKLSSKKFYQDMLANYYSRQGQ